MNTLSFLGLIQNAALLLSLVLVFDVFVLRWSAGQEASLQRRLLAGLIISIIGIAVMLTPWVLVPGLVFDTRSVLLSISGLFFGPVPTLIAMAITAALRLLQGGPGVWPGVSTVLVTGSLGLIWRRVRRRRLDEIKLPELYLFGLVTHLIMLALMFTLPWEMALHTLRNISAPVLMIYPIASALLGRLMANRLKREKLIDERRYAEQTLAQERRLLRTLIDNLPDAIYAKDLQGRKTLANRADLDNIGLPEAEVLGKTDAELFPPEVAARFMADDQAVLNSGTPVHDREELLTNRDGKTFWQLTSKVPFHDADGQIVGLVGIGRDITERKQAMEALQNSEADIKEAQQIAQLGRWEFDLTTRQLQWSDSIFEIFEIEPERFGASYEAFLDSVHPDDRTMVDHAYSASLRDGTPYEITHRLLMQDGRIKWVHEICRNEYNAQGEPIRSIGVVQDITERKQTEEALRAERDLVSRVMETSPAGIVMVNREGQIEFANRQAEQVLGLSRDQMHERTYNDPEWRHTDYDGGPFPDDAQPFSQVQRTLRPVNDVRQAIEWPDGRRVLLRINAAPMLGESGTFNGMIATVEDVTAQVQAQEMLRMTQFAVEQASIEVYWIDEDGRLIYVNKRACEALGYTPEQLLTMNIIDIDPNFSTERWHGYWQEILQQRKTFTLESRHRTREGHIYPVEITVNYLEYNGKGYNFAFGVDITERKRAESEMEKILAALRESEQKYRALFEQMTEGFALHEVITDAQGVPCDYRFLELNPAYEQITSLKRAECLGKTVLEILPGLDPHWITDYGKVALTGEPAYLEDYVPELERYYEVWAYSPRPRQFATLVKDVTERRQQEIERAALLEAEHEQRLRAETLRDVTLALASALDTSDVLMEILHQAQRLVPSTASNIALVEGETLHIVGWRGYTEYGIEQELAGMLQPLSDYPINAELIANGEPYITADAHDDPHWQHLPATAWIRAHISVPIRLGENVVGVLRLDSDQVGTFSPQDVERLLPLTRAAAIALENAQLYTQAQQELEERKRSQAALEASERKFREMLENMHLFALMLDLEGRVTFCNDFGLQLVGMERDAVLGCDWFETFIPSEIRAEMHATFAKNFANGSFPPHHENEILVEGGTSRALIAWNNMVVRDPDNNIIGVSAIGEDITAQRQAESALKASEAWLRSFVDSMDDVIFSLDTEQRHTALYGQWIERMGTSPESFLGRTARDIFGPEAGRVHETANRQVLATGVSVTYEWEVNDAHFQTTLSPLPGPEGEVIGLVGVGRDITALKDSQRQLQTALDEKTLMLSEIHHRIKNNLQVILGLLELQFGAIEDEGTQQMLRESQNRIKAIALIHERLYQTPGESQVNAQLYFQSLARYLTQTYDAMVRGIVVEQSIADLELDIDLAIPCALIMNELIANALKYAFPPEWQSPDGAPPTLRVALHQVDGHARLEVADNGVGLPESVESETSTRLGLRLIKMLTRQIDGELSIAQNAGTCIAVTFTWNEEK
ncbi:MAG: PAS domain S-box protein [Anaerolineae bacterium]